MAGAGINAVAHGVGGIDPSAAGDVFSIPCPVIFGGVDFFAGAGGHVLLEGNRGAVEGNVAGFDFDHPVLRSADSLLSGGFAFEKKSGAV